MKEYFGTLKLSGLFNGIDDDGLEATLKCLNPEIKSVSRNEILLLAGDKPEHVGIVLAGQLRIIREDYDGNRSVMAAVSPGEIFAEALCCAGIAESPVTVIADSGSAVMLLRFSSILQTCTNTCIFHAKLIENMLRLIANKNLLLQSRMEILGLKSIRTKVIRYLESFAPPKGQEFAIPFNREELADFLCVERSALSHELAKMKRDGLLEYKKNRFVLHHAASQ